MARLIAPPLLTKLAFVTRGDQTGCEIQPRKTFLDHGLFLMEILTKDNLSPAVGNLRGSGTGMPRGETITEPAEARRRTVWRAPPATKR